jgi:transcription antitermination factor NusG
MYISQGKCWYALQVRTNYEQLVASALKQVQVEYLLPTYKIRSERKTALTWLERPLFPGYLFGNIDLKCGPKLYNMPGTIRIVSYGRWPVPVSLDEIESIRIIASGEVPVTPCSFLTAGDEVIVLRGPLRGIRGIYVEAHSAGHFIVVSFPLLKRSVNVRLDVDAVERTSFRDLTNLSRAS